MWFAIVACVSGALLVIGSWRVARAQPSPLAIEACVRSLRSGAASVPSGDGIATRVAELVAHIGRASSRSSAIAELNEFIADVDIDTGAEVPLTLARVCFTLGVLLGVLSLATGLRSGTGVGFMTAFPALAALLSGLMSGMVCYQLGLAAKRRRQEFRQLLRQLKQLLEQRLPP